MGKGKNIMTWFERHAAQAASARKRANKARQRKLPGKGNRSAWRNKQGGCPK